MDHSGLKLHRDTSVQQSGTNFLLYAWTKPIRDFDAFLFTKSHSVLSINFVIVHPSRPLASKNVFVCHILLVIDHTHHGSKVKQKKFLENCLISGFFTGILGQWHHTSNPLDTGHWCAIVSYFIVFWNIALFYLSKKPFQTFKQGTAWIWQKKAMRKRGSGLYSTSKKSREFVYQFIYFPLVWGILSSCPICNSNFWPL